MDGMPDWAVWGVVGGAFAVGYGLVSIVMKRVKELQNRPSLMDDLWREDQGVAGNRERGEASSPTEADPGAVEGRTDVKPESSNPR